VRDARVPKYEHRIRTVLNLRRDETAVLCLLMLRGSQTPGELRSRADRLYSFDDLETVQSTLERLGSRPTNAETGTEAPTGPLTTILPRQPGSREARYVHLLGDLPPTPPQRDPRQTIESPSTRSADATTIERLARIEAEIATVTTALSDLQSRIDRLESNR
jgi:uncharacterized protein